MEKALRPIYQAIDLKQYSKALKFTLLKPQNTWPITIALKCHCLERCGPAKHREACVELRSLLSILGDDWSELDERIWLLSLDSNLSGVVEADAGRAASGATSSGKSSSGKKGNAKSKSKKQQAQVPAEKPAASPSIELDVGDALDISLAKRQNIAKNKVSKTKLSGIQPFELTDETTIATLCISLSALNLPHTIAQVYTYAIQHLQKMISSQPGLKESLCTLLVQGYLSHLKLIATMTPFSPNSQEEQTHHERVKLSAWQDAQFFAMSLVKHSGEALYQSWLILAVMEHYKSCQALLQLLEKSATAGNEEEIQKLKQKESMLPRLSLMMAMKQVQTHTSENDKEPAQFLPSSDDVRLYVECLTSLSKYQEALEFLDQINVKSKQVGKGNSKKINDEKDVNNHVGSLIQLTEKEVLEMKIDMLLKMNLPDEAFNIYSKSLLHMMPDQWVYWKGLLECSEECSSLGTDSNEYLARCQEVLDSVHAEEARKKVEGNGPKIPLRGPYLFNVEMAACRVRGVDLPNSGIASLSQEILNYGTLFAPLVFCCFQDLRNYIELLVNKSTDDGTLSGEIKKLLIWGTKLRQENDPSKISDGEETSSEKQERRAKLRAYIFSVKLCFEIWFHLNAQCKGESNKMQLVDDAMEEFIPSSDEMIQNWNNTMDLGSNPKDGGQKECLPGDDLVLLTVQLLEHKRTHNSKNLLASALLENALHYSPYNPYIKIATVNMHMLNGAATRAWDTFKDMDVKQIQLDSCSYFILQHLVNHGLYKETINQAGRIITLHSSNVKDLCSFMAKAFENGNLDKGREMISWQRNKMSQSLQLLEAKGLIMDLAPLLNYGDPSDPKSPPPIGVVHGLCGGDNDVERVEKIIRDSGNFYAAPSLLHLSGDEASGSSAWSDNRDFDVNQYEILTRTSYGLDSHESFARAHMHSLLAKLVLVTEAQNPPKKGKVVKVKAGETLDKRSKSLWRGIEKAEKFLAENRDSFSKAHAFLWEATMSLSKVMCIVATGRLGSETPIDSDDNLGKREKNSIPFIETASKKITESLALWKNHCDTERVSLFRLLPDILISLFAVFRIATNTIAKFGWGKRKRDTKPVAKSIADVAETLNKLITDLMQTLDGISETPESLMTKFDSTESSFVNSADLKEKVEKVIDDIILSQNEVKSRIRPILTQMIEEFESFM